MTSKMTDMHLMYYRIFILILSYL